MLSVKLCDLVFFPLVFFFILLLLFFSCSSIVILSETNKQTNYRKETFVMKISYNLVRVSSDASLIFYLHTVEIRVTHT